MAVWNIIAKGVGFNPGEVGFIVTHGFGAVSFIPSLPGLEWSMSSPKCQYSQDAPRIHYDQNADRLHYDQDGSRIHYDQDGRRVHYTMPDD